MMTEKINTHLANDLEQSAAMIDSREFDAVQLDNCASMMRYAATVIRQALANEALDKMAENARDLGLSYEQPIPSTMKQAIIEEASIQMTGHPSKDARCFAKSVYEYLMAEQPAQEPLSKKLDDALRSERHNTVAETRYWCDQYKQIAREAVKALAEQPAQQEPDPDELTIAYMSGLHEGKKRKPWVGLTDDERRHLRKCNQQHDAYALAVEALLKEKNT
jgi:hypothetical protein